MFCSFFNFYFGGASHMFLQVNLEEFIFVPFHSLVEFVILLTYFPITILLWKPLNLLGFG